jgi:hypothetical protein
MSFSVLWWWWTLETHVEKRLTLCTMVHVKWLQSLIAYLVCMLLGQMYRIVSYSLSMPMHYTGWAIIMGHILFVIYESGGTLTYLKCIIFQSLNLGVNVGLFYSSLVLNDGTVDAGGNCIHRGSSIVTAQRRFWHHFQKREVPSWKVILCAVSNFCETGNANKKPSPGRPRMSHRAVNIERVANATEPHASGSVVRIAFVL